MKVYQLGKKIRKLNPGYSIENGYVFKGSKIIGEIRTSENRNVEEIIGLPEDIDEEISRIILS